MIRCNCEQLPACGCEKGVACLKHVTFRRGDRVVLEDITFCIDEGIFLGLIGPNGGGKTTLLKLMLGLLPMQEGHIEVFHRSPANLARDRWLIGYVPQRHEVDKNFPASAMDVVLMGAIGKTGLLRRIPRAARERAAQMLEMVGIADLRDRPIGRMSGGQQQRAFIARALVSEPKLLILDEPCIGLDPASRERFLQDLDEFAAGAESPTMILVTHHIEELRPWVRQVLMLKDGKILAQGEPEDVICSTTMSKLFDGQCQVGKGENGYWLRMETAV